MYISHLLDLSHVRYSLFEYFVCIRHNYYFVVNLKTGYLCHEQFILIAFFQHKLFQ